MTCAYHGRSPPELRPDMCLKVKLPFIEAGVVQLRQHTSYSKFPGFPSSLSRDSIIRWINSKCVLSYWIRNRIGWLNPALCSQISCLLDDSSAVFCCESAVCLDLVSDSFMNQYCDSTSAWGIPVHIGGVSICLNLLLSTSMSNK